MIGIKKENLNLEKRLNKNKASCEWTRRSVKRSVADCEKSSPEHIRRRDRGRRAAPDYGSADKDRLCWFGWNPNKLTSSGVRVNNEIYHLFIKIFNGFDELAENTRDFSRGMNRRVSFCYNLGAK